MRSFVKENLGRMARNHLWVNDEGAELPTFVQAYQFFARNPEQNSAVRVRYGPQIRAESAAETRFGDYSRKVGLCSLTQPSISAHRPTRSSTRLATCLPAFNASGNSETESTHRGFRATPWGHGLSQPRPYCDSFVTASAALPATTQLADPATTASSSNQRNPKSSMHSGKSGLMMMYPGITAPGM